MPSPQLSIEIVSATRGGPDDFKVTPLGLSLRRMARDARLAPNIAYDNTRGLPEIYNARIGSSEADILCFIHDDVWIDDFYFADRLIEGLKMFDVVGLAGNTRRLPMQRMWSHRPVSREQDVGHLAGALAHGMPPNGEVSFYGPPARCALLDGVMLAARRASLSKAAFDPRFNFHFYDLDFCRTADRAGLTLGTWPIAVTHLGAQTFGQPEWLAASALYFEKWGD